LDKPRYVLADSLVLEKPRDFSFFLTASVYNFSWWFNGEKLFVPLGDAVLVFRDIGSEVEVSVYTRPSADSDTVDRAAEYARHILGLGEDLSDFYAIALRDPLLSQSIDFLRGLRVRASTPWLATVVGICQQNASFKQGWRMFYNFLKMLGSRVVVEGSEVVVPPRPEDLGENAASLLREAGFGYRVSAVLGVARVFEKNPGLDSWGASPGELEEQLLSVKGVGHYTSRLALVLSLRVYDRPPIDRWLKEIARRVYGIADARDVERVYTSVWDRWSGLAVFYTTVALDAEPLSAALKRIENGLTRPDPGKLSPLTMWRYL